MDKRPFIAYTKLDKILLDESVRPDEMQTLRKRLRIHKVTQVCVNL